MSGIFISYRRDDQAGFAGRLADALGAAFGEDSVFRDIEDIHPGEDFVDAIDRHLVSVDVMLVMIGPQWLTLSRNGVRRLDEPDDFVRREIEAGLASEKMVLPVLVGGASMPADKDLPESIRALGRRQSFVLTDAGWAADINRLTALIRSRFQPIARLSSGRKWIWALAAALVLGVAGIVWKSAGRTELTTGQGQLAAGVATVLEGKWTAAVTYDWGAQHKERFDLRPEGGALRGTASFLGVDRTVEQGTVAGDQLDFITRTQEVQGDGPGREVTHHYRARLVAGVLQFELESLGGFSAHTPIRFDAVRALTENASR